MDGEIVDQILDRVFVVCNRGKYSHNLRIRKPAIKNYFMAMPLRQKEYIDRLTGNGYDLRLNNLVAEITALFILDNISEPDPSRNRRQRFTFASQLCIVENVYEAALAIGADLGSGDLWVALLHFEMDEKHEPFTTDYLNADDALRRKYIAHSCLDFCLPGGKVTHDLVEYTAENLESLTEICIIVKTRRTFDTDTIRTALEAPHKGLSSGAL